MRGDVTIFPIPRRLQPANPLLDQSCHFIGPTIDSTIRDSDLDPELTEHLANPEPHVLISLGTLHAGSEDFFRTCFAALADIPARILISVGAHIDSARLGQIGRLLAALALAPVACATAAITWSSWRAAADNTKPAPATTAAAANGHRPDHLVPLQE